MKGRIRSYAALAAVQLMAAAGTALAQGGKVVAKYHRYWLPDEGTKIAGEVDNLFYVILWITGIVGVAVFLVMGTFLVRYRFREGRKATYYHGNNRLEIGWTIAPALILILLAFFSKSVWSEMKQQAPDEKSAFVVEVRPRQFEWDVTYAGGDGKFGTADDISAINQLHVPAGKDVLVKLTAQDVIHSFFVPEFRVKQDAVPGMMTRYWFNTSKAGNYEIACAELCGMGHYRMRGFLTIHEPADFDKWYKQQIDDRAKELAPPPPPAAATPATAMPSTASASATDTSHAASSPAPKDTAGASH